MDILVFYHSQDLRSAYPLDSSILNLLLRLALSAIMLVSGLGKLRDQEGTRQAVGDFGVPARWVESAAKVLVATELLLAATILLDLSYFVAGYGLLMLFSLFCAGIANLLSQDKAPPCHCFGAVHSAPVSRWTLLRTVGFAVMAWTVCRTPQFSLTPGVKSLVLVAGAFSLSAFAIDKRVRTRIAKGLHNKPRRLGVGQRVPAVRLLDGRWLESVLSRHQRSLLVLTSDACGPCKKLEEPLNRWAEALRDCLPIIRIRSGETSGESAGPGTDVFLRAEDFRRFLSPTPGAILVDHKGTVVSPPVAGEIEIEALIRMALAQQSHAHTV